MVKAEKASDRPGDFDETLCQALELLPLAQLGWQSKRTVPLSSLSRVSDHWAALMQVRREVRRSRSARKRVNVFVNRYAQRAANDLRGWLGLKRGRLRDSSKWQVWTTGARLRVEDPKKFSWRKLTMQLDPEGYAQDSQLAVDRMRHGIEASLKEMRDSGKSA